MVALVQQSNYILFFIEVHVKMKLVYVIAWFAHIAAPLLHAGYRSKGVVTPPKTVMKS